MAKRCLRIEPLPIQHKNQALRMTKAYSAQEFTKHTVLTDDIFTYVSFYFDTHKKSMKYDDNSKKEKYGDPSQYHYKFYWEQARIFYKSAKSIECEASPVAAYYCILNAVKAYLSFTSNSVDDFVEEFGQHGIYEDNGDIGESLSTISIKHKQKGVFPLFANRLDDDFSTKWPAGNGGSLTLKHILYNLAFIHRAYSMTYSSRDKSVEELFVPLSPGECPKYHKASDGKAHLIIRLDKKYFSPVATRLPSDVQNTISSNFKPCEEDPFSLYSVEGSKKNQGSVSSELKTHNTMYRKFFSYIRSNHRIWYIKRSELRNDDVVNLSSMTLIMAAMHRISEIARYKPEQLNRLLKSKENWLIHEFISLALDQFLDEIACEITHQEIMCTGQNNY